MRPRLSFCVLSVVLPVCIQAGDPPLTLAACVRQALAHGFTMEIQRLDPLLAQDRLAAAQAAFQPKLTTTIGTSADQAAGITEPGAQSDDLNAGASLSQLLPTGTSLSIVTNLNRRATDAPLGSFDPAYAAGTTVAVKHPLGQGAGSHITTLSRRLAELGITTADRDVAARALDVINRTENAYYQLVGAREQRTVVTASRDLARRLRDEAAVREKAGVATKLDVTQAEVGLASAESSLLQAETAVQNAEDALHTIIGQFTFDKPIGETSLPTATDARPEVEAVFAEARANAPDFLNRIAALEGSRLQVDAARDALKPDLSLELSANFNGFGARGDSAYDRSFDRNHTQWFAGLSWSKPWGQHAEKAGYRSAKTALQQQELSLQQAEQELLGRVRAAVRAVTTNFRAVELAGSSVTLSEQQHVLQLSRFQQGLATSRQVLEAQIDLESARVREIQARIQLQSALAAIRQLTGRSFEHYELNGDRSS